MISRQMLLDVYWIPSVGSVVGIAIAWLFFGNAVTVHRTRPPRRVIPELTQYPKKDRRQPLRETKNVTFRDWHSIVPMFALLLGVLVAGDLGYCQEGRSNPAEEKTEGSKTAPVGQANHDRDSAVPHLPEATTKLPAWMEEGMPFDVERYLASPRTSDNAATSYLDALLEFDDSMDICFVDDWDISLLPPEYATRLAVTKMRWNWAVWVLTRFESDPKSVDVEELDDLLKAFDNGFKKLREAQELRRCVFQTAIGPLALMPHAGAASHVGEILSLRVHRRLADGNLDAALDDVHMLVRLARDLRPRGNAFCQAVSLRLELSCWNDLVPQVLSCDELTIEQCDRIIKLAAPRDQEIDPCLEGERYQQVMWRKLIHELEHNEYDVAARAKELDLSGSFIVPTMLLCELADFGSYRINRDVVQQFAEKAVDQAGQNEELRELYEKISEQQKGEHGPATMVDRMLATMMLTQGLMNLPPEGFRREYAVLDQRYRQMEKAVGMPFPKRIEHLAMLESWTSDDVWEKTSMLRLFKPQFVHPENVRIVTLRRRLAMCLAAVARARLAGTREFVDLEKIAQGAELSHVPLDPYSGAPLRMAQIDGQIVVYSVGPDGDDDQARPVNFAGWQYPFVHPPDGDVCLRLPSLSKVEGH